MNAIANCTITMEDLEFAENIFGPDVKNIKGKSTITKPNTVSIYGIEIPK